MYGVFPTIIFRIAVSESENRRVGKLSTRFGRCRAEAARVAKNAYMRGAFKSMTNLPDFSSALLPDSCVSENLIEGHRPLSAAIDMSRASG